MDAECQKYLCILQVMRTCKEMGIKSVAIYSDADAQAVSTDFYGLKYHFL